jgi:hypothetical protein
MPFPNEEATPPVTNIYLVGIKNGIFISKNYVCISGKASKCRLIIQIIDHADFPVKHLNILF